MPQFNGSISRTNRTDFFGLHRVAPGAHCVSRAQHGVGRCTGDVTKKEYESFLDKLASLPPPPTHNVGNLMVYEKDGTRLHGMQTFYSFTKERKALDLAIVWSDAFLHARNDPVNGRIVWTGKRELCWPNKATNDVIALYSGAENGDVIEHIVNTAKLILEEPSLWGKTAPKDTYGFGATYLDRAKTYVRECQRSAETTIVPWYVKKTKAGDRLYRNESAAYVTFYKETGPLPWNQQQCVTGGLLWLAQCHRLLKDGNPNIEYYEKITRDAADWFFSTSLLVNVKGKNCYDWGYELGEEIGRHQEDCGHSGYDMFIMRDYEANLGPSRVQMQRLVNTALYVISLGTNRFSGYVNGVVDQSRPERNYLNFEWIEMSVLDHRLYELLANAVLVGHEYYDNVPVQAAVLYAKHYWATAPAGTQTEVVDTAKGGRPLPPSSSRSLRHWPRQSIIVLGWALLRVVAGGVKTIWEKCGFKGSTFLAPDLDCHRCGGDSEHLGRIPPSILPIAVADNASEWGIRLFVFGLGLRWYAIIHLGRFFTTNVAIAADHHVIDTGPIVSCVIPATWAT